MDRLELIVPSIELKEKIVQYKEEHFRFGDMQVHGSGGLAYFDYFDEWLKHINEISADTSVFFTKRVSDGKLIGCIKIHHSLTEQLQSGGHIAYGVRPSERKKGYGTCQLTLCLEYAKSIELDQVIIACDKSNEASAKTAINCGGILINEYMEDGVLKQHYSIDLMTTNIIFVRHAQSVYGEDDRTRPLSEAGLKDREIVLDTLKDRQINAFLSSPYKRSMDTIKPASEHFGMDITTDERLRERKAGSYEEGLLEKRWQDFTFAEEGGECLDSVQKRNIEALTDILDKYKGKTIVIGTHGTALSTILHHYNNDFGVKDFLRIVNWMPYIVELRFNNNELVELIELAHVDKG